MKASGWGRYPCIEATAVWLRDPARLAERLKDLSACIVHARGRSYGDAALSENLIMNLSNDRLLGFDSQSGTVAVESGITIADLVGALLPRGWFPGVTPGTRFISVGGAIACDVHGKNHHKVGCFSEFVLSFDLMLPDGDVVKCSRDENSDLFRATCGGMGLTGIILRAVLRLQRVGSARIRETVIRCRNLADVLEKFDAHDDKSYSVAWIDCLSSKDALGRSVLMLGEHSDSGAQSCHHAGCFSVPFNFPGFALNRYTASAFNHFYYENQPLCVKNRLTTIDAFFYPLDRVAHWNRVYGSRGFLQYQLVVPKEAGPAGLRAILEKAGNCGAGSFLGVLKLFGPENENLLSFPMEGYTLAMDFKVSGDIFSILNELDRVVLDHGGRIYLAKDARMPREVFRKGYPCWEKFVELRERYRMSGKFQSLQSKRLGI